MKSSRVLVPDAVDARPVGDVVVDRHGQDLGLLGQEAHLLADRGHLDLRPVDVLAVDQDLPLDPDAVHGVEQPVEGLEEGRLAAAGRPDDGRDLAVGDVQADVLEDLEPPVVNVQVPDLDMGSSSMMDLSLI